MTTGAVAAGWYPDPGALHEWRWWDGRRWSSTINDGGVAAIDEMEDATTATRTPPAPMNVGVAVPPPPPFVPVAPASPAEMLRFALYFAIIIGGPFVFDPAWPIGSLIWIVAPALFFVYIAERIGYRARDLLLLLIPVWGIYLIGKFCWRLACLPRRYWAPAPPRAARATPRQL